MRRGGLIFASFLFACSSSSTNPESGSGGSGGSAGSTGQGPCVVACAKCDTEGCQDCAGMTLRFRTEFASALYACVTDADACTPTLWQDCTQSAESTLSPRPIDKTFTAACMSKHTACQADSPFADDYCANIVLLSDAKVVEAGKCLDKLCVEIEPCLKQAFGG